MCTMNHTSSNTGWAERGCDSGLEETGRSERHGYCPQIPRILSHIHVVRLSHNQSGDRKVGVKEKQSFPSLLGGAF